VLKPSDKRKLVARHDALSFQLEAVEAVKGMKYSALFHEQGLGKTKIALDLTLEWLKADAVDCVIVVTKKALVANWMAEVNRHTFLRPRVLGQDHRANFFAFNSTARLFITHYEVIQSEEKRLRTFLKTRRVGIILDESQKIKNPDTDLAKAFHRLSDDFERRVIMTGTPIANRPYDIWSQIYFLDKGESLGDDFPAFKEHVDLTNELWKDREGRETFEQSLASIFSKLSAFSVRRTKSSSGISLPEKVIQNISLKMEQRQAELYEAFRRDLRSEVLRDGEVVEDDAEAVLKRLTRLVQVASNPLLVDEGYHGVPGKFPVLLDLLQGARDQGAKAIVWTSYVENVRWLARHLQQFGPAVIHGSLSIEDRNASASRFISDDDIRVLIATPGAAKEGLTLTVANRAIFYDRSFSLDDYLQAQDRIHRISQTETCYVQNLIAEGTIDEWVDALLTAKRLAAQLAQADISPEDYKAQANYEFGRLVAEILGADA